jgi:hypothetical protein
MELRYVRYLNLQIEQMNSRLKKVPLSIIVFFAFSSAFAQTQIVKGVVKDAQGEYPLIGVTVLLVGSDPIKGTSTDLDGKFVLENVPVGRQQLAFQYIGYQSTSYPNVLVTAGKEVVLNVRMEESVEQLKEIVVSGNANKDQPINEMAKISARTFDLEEVTRFSGGRNDVARLATNFAGVSSPDDSRNDIAVRGNSPTALLWRIEGIPMANTNHFSTLGTTGGPVSALNTNLLQTSDFLTGAFPAEYGNANAAVFDVKLRNGNTETAEYTAQISAFSGAEFMAEGPINKEKGTSYLASARYGIASLAATGTSATPYYQDFSFKLNLGQTKWGRLSIFGLAGQSSIDFFGDEIDEEDLFANPNRDAYVESALGLGGISLFSVFNQSTYLRTTLGATFNQTTYDQDNLMRDSLDTFLGKYRATEVLDREVRYTMTSTLNKKYSSRLNARFGGMAQAFHLHSQAKDRDNRVDIPDEDGDGVPDYFLTTRDVDEVLLLAELYAQGEYKFTDQLSLTVGLHTQYLDYTTDQTIEPRAALSWKVRPNQRFTIAYGLHSQMAPLPILFLASEQDDGSLLQTNKDLKFMKSHHYILGYDRNLGESWRLKIETYYQDLYDIPVERTGSYSIINEGGDFIFDERSDLVNKGTATNYGLELTLEKFFSKGYYGLLTTSVFESKYKGADGVERNTAFNKQLVGNVLLGKEWKVGANKKNALTMDTKLTMSNGKPYTPIDLEATRANAGREVRYENLAYSENYNAYLRWDVKVGFQLNSSKRKIAHQFFVDFQNVLDRENEFVRRYNQVTDEINLVKQIGFFPDVLYRIQF